MGIYSQGGWNQLMKGSTNGIPNAFLANAALHPEAQVMVGSVGRQLGDPDQGATFSWRRLTPGAAEQMLAGTSPGPKPAQLGRSNPQGQSCGRLELTYEKRNGTQKVVNVNLTTARQLVIGSNGNPLVEGGRVQFLRQTKAGARIVKSRPLVGVRLFPAAK